MSTSTATSPTLDGFETHYGVPVAYIGEDGDIIALGHHDARTTIAAMNRLARKQCGLANLFDERRRTYEAALARLAAGYAVELADECRECGSDPECTECEALRRRAPEEWCLVYRGVDQIEPGSFPVMIWEA